MIPWNNATATYYNVLRKLNNNERLHGKEIEQLEKIHIDKIFCNYESIKNKVRLYNFAINSHITEKQIDIALKYINISSFIVKGNFSVPFKLSYFYKVPDLKPDFVLFISEAAANWGKVTRNAGTCYIDVVFDINRKQMREILFPICIEDFSLYDLIVNNFGFECSVCNGSGKIKNKKCYKCEGRSKK